MSWEDRSERVDRGAARFVWQQIADDLAADIDSGELRGRLPAEAALADVYGVARNTIRRAVVDLVTRGLVTVLHGRGTFVVKRDQ